MARPTCICNLQSGSVPLRPSSRFELRDVGQRRSPAGALPDSVDQFPDPRQMMIVVFGDKIQMVYQSHRRL